MLQRRIWITLGLIFLCLSTALPLSAQTPTPNEVNAVARELWCPLCNGVRLDNCELQACVQMREVIAQKLTAGESKEQIKAYFVKQYGDIVLGAPSSQGFNLLAWILPALVAAVGLGWLAFFVRGLLRHRPTTLRQPVAEDEYLKRVDNELQRYQ